MRFLADFHIHSHFSVATSKKLVPEHLEHWARIKGLDVMGTGDCIHPGWLAELEEKLEPAENGLLALRPTFRLPESRSLRHERVPSMVYFMLTGEISSIYKKDGRVRKIHNVCVFPDFASLRKVQARLGRIGNITSDGRPILGLDARTLLEMVLESSDRAYMIPAHIWTPWFSLFGSQSGFDSTEECFGDLADRIFAMETGLSSDPAMNWACSFLDRYKLVSNSDAHSPEKIGREANAFDADLGYDGILEALRGDSGFEGTIEFFPQEGKYHMDGHRKCGVRLDPLETAGRGGLCPACGRPLTVGVMHRVAELADRDEVPDFPNRRPFRSITPLPDVLAEILSPSGRPNKAVEREYHRLIGALGSEFHILLDAGLDGIETVGGALLAEGIRRLRAGDVIIEEGYDGEFGRIKVFAPGEAAAGGLFSGSVPSGTPGEAKGSLRFSIKEFREKKAALAAGPVLPEAVKESGPAPVPGGLSARQREAVDLGGGPCLVVAGPGSGKTRVLVERIARLVEKEDAAPENILALTFSNKAAGEMRDRLEAVPGAEKITVSTFHAFGLSVLKKYADRTGRSPSFIILDDDERLDLLAEACGDRKNAPALGRSVEAWKQGRGDGSDPGIQSYENLLRESDAFDLDDLVHLPACLIEEDEGIAGSARDIHRFLFIDEFQDINARQYDLIRALAPPPGAGIFVIGDPDQAIYGFRGSDVSLMERFRTEYSPAVIELDRSYRCSGTVLRAASQVLEKSAFFTGREDGGRIEVLEAATDRSEADWIAARIESLVGGTRSFSLDSGMADGRESASFSDFCVLCRSSFMFPAIAEAMQNHGIAYQLVSTDQVFREEPFRSALRLLGRCHSRRAGKGTGAALESEVSGMIAEGVSAARIMKFILTEQGADEAAIARAVVLAEPFGDRCADLLRAVSLRQGVDDYADKSDAVCVMTMHASKGLEFNHVFIAGCEEGILPFELFGPRSAEEIEEEKRLFYVAATRTRQSLCLTWARTRRYRGRLLKGGRSRFVESLRRDLVRVTKRGPAKKQGDDGQMELFPLK